MAGDDRSRAKQSRAADDRSQEERPELGQWSPAAILELPPDIGGYRYRWVAEYVNGSHMGLNVQRALRERWVRVNYEELDDFYKAACDETRDDGYARAGGLIMMKMPLEYALQRQEYYLKQSQGAIMAANELQGVAGANSVTEDRSRGLTGREVAQALT